MITITIPGEPVPQGRGRAVRMGNSVKVVDPARSRGWKAMAAQEMRRQWRGTLNGPVSVVILAVFPCPKADHRKRQKPARRWHTGGNGDLDNIAKAVLDAGNQAGIWADDRQVCQLTARKMIAAQDESPFVQVTVSPPPELG